MKYLRSQAAQTVYIHVRYRIIHCIRRNIPFCTLFFAGDMKNILNENFVAQYGRPDVIITDPPRAGMHEDVANVILDAEPKRIVYVSCNPATQARDLQLLDAKYRVTKVQPVDMFPHTQHVEKFLQLELKTKN